MLFLLYGYIVPRYNKSWGSWEFRDLLRQGLAPESIPPPARSGTGKSAHILWTVKKFFLHMFLVHGFWFFFVHLLFEMGNSEGISQSSFYTDSYIQKLQSWRM